MVIGQKSKGGGQPQLPPNPLIIKIKLVCLAVVLVVCITVIAVLLHDVNSTGDSYLEGLRVKSANGVTDSKMKFKTEWDASRILAIEEQIKANGGSYSGISSIAFSKGVHITGNSLTDHVDGWLVAWTYVCANYEVAGPYVAGLQGHYNCTCKNGTPNVSTSYGSSSVAHGPFQMDSKYQLNGLLQFLSANGIPELQPYIYADTIHDGNRAAANAHYKTYESRNSIHQILMKYQNEAPADTYGLMMKYCFVDSNYTYLDNDQLSRLENAVGRSRYEIHPGVIAVMYAGNIYCGKGAGNAFINKVAYGMTDEQLLDTLLEVRHSLYCSTHGTAGSSAVKAHSTITKRNQNERELVMAWMNDPNWDIYDEHSIPDKGKVHWGRILGLR